MRRLYVQTGALLVLDDSIDHNVFSFHNDLLLPGGMSSVNVCAWLPTALFSSVSFRSLWALEVF